MHVLQLGGLSGNIKRILDSLRFTSSPSPSIIAAPLAVSYFGLICKEVAKVVPAQTLAATNLADQGLTETMQKLLIVMQRLDDKIGLMLESDGEFFNKRWGFFSRAGLWDKRYLMRQIEKYGYLFSAFSEQLVVYLSHFLLSKLVSGMLTYTHQEYPTSSTTHPSCISTRRSRYKALDQIVEKLGRVPLINCAKTSMSPKLISGDSDFFANLVVDAVLSVKMTNQRGEIKYPIKGINILKAHGQSARDSYLLKEYALNTGSAAQGCH
ncbi:hypothetical protein HID58_072550 [Brassica napus]|uniref:Uncharacterized protein n=1 Tax=Brassica napus TaxID=3708 RepID=A0ABQ7Z4X0_BRANA|nr:hypothetical protein HID58_072550 [Brassica napus]